MPRASLTRAAILGIALSGFACAGNKSDTEVGAAPDSTVTAKVDSTGNQTESGVTDSTGESTLGKGVEQTRPDQGQPVTSKGDTINQAVDSAGQSANQAVDSASQSANQAVDSVGQSANQAVDSVGQSADSANAGR